MAVHCPVVLRRNKAKQRVNLNDRANVLSWLCWAKQPNRVRRMRTWQRGRECEESVAYQMALEANKQASTWDCSNSDQFSSCLSWIRPVCVHFVYDLCVHTTYGTSIPFAVVQKPFLHIRNKRQNIVFQISCGVYWLLATRQAFATSRLNAHTSFHNFFLLFQLYIRSNDDFGF